jgi:hypothetical protein
MVNDPPKLPTRSNPGHHGQALPMSDETSAHHVFSNERALALGDGAIRKRLTELATEKGVAYAGLALDVRSLSRMALTIYEYRLLATDRSIAFRAHDVRLASEPHKMRRYIEPRLKAMFEDIWWRKSVVLLAGRSREEDDETRHE